MVLFAMLATAPGVCNFGGGRDGDEPVLAHADPPGVPSSTPIDARTPGAAHGPIRVVNTGCTCDPTLYASVWTAWGRG